MNACTPWGSPVPVAPTNAAPIGVFDSGVGEEDPLAVPNPALTAFARVSLDAGETKEVEISLESRAFTTGLLFNS